MLRHLAIVTVVGGIGVAAVCASWTRAPLAPPANALTAPHEGMVRATESVLFDGGLRADVSFWMSGHFMTLPDAMNPDPTLVRVYSVSVIFNVKQVVLTHATLNGTVDVSKAQPFVAEATNIDLDLVKVFAAQALGVAVPESQGTLSGPYTVEIRPVAGKTWAEVSSAVDIEVAKK